MTVTEIDKLTDDLRTLLDNARRSGESIQIVDKGQIVAHIVPSPRHGAVSMTADQLAQSLSQPHVTYPDDSEPAARTARRVQNEAVLASMDELAQRLAKVWPEGVSALDAIDDVRRDL